MIVRPQLFWFIPALFMLAAQACAGAAQREASSGRSSRMAPAADVTGLWEGTAVNGCGFVQMERTRCHGVVDIALTMTQRGSTVGGSYKCSTGTMMCRKVNETGVIAYGAVHKGGLSLRVVLPDGSSCIFQSKRSANRMAGAYICFAGCSDCGTRSVGGGADLLASSGLPTSMQLISTLQTGVFDMSSRIQKRGFRIN